MLLNRRAREKKERKDKERGVRKITEEPESARLGPSTDILGTMVLRARVVPVVRGASHI